MDRKVSLPVSRRSLLSSFEFSLFTGSSKQSPDCACAERNGMISRKPIRCFLEQPAPRGFMSRAGNGAIKALSLL
jgi:hypothetical protein